MSRIIPVGEEPPPMKCAEPEPYPQQKEDQRWVTMRACGVSELWKQIAIASLSAGNHHITATDTADIVACEFIDRFGVDKEGQQ